MYFCLCGIRGGGSGKTVGSFGAVNLRIDLALHICFDHCRRAQIKDLFVILIHCNKRLDVCGPSNCSCGQDVIEHFSPYGS